jgi:UDP-2,4-diacetamido-2,4,6-trideoxy-beta-L-altropyranose hydrolase
MNVFVRVDASEKIGTGHFYRCLTLSLKVISKGHNVTFISRKMPEDLIRLLEKKNIQFKTIFNNSSSEIGNLSHSHWLEVGQLEDANNFKKVIQNKIDLLIIDHYGIDYIWENELRKIAKKILVIDDLADRRHVCDYLLDQNYYTNLSSRYFDRLSSNAITLLGPDYCLLRDDFLKIRSSIEKKVTKGITRVFIFFGGIDSQNYTKVALEVLKKIGAKDLIVDVVVGSQNPNKESIQETCNNFGYNYFCQTSRIAEIMYKSDLAIGAGGSTSWERCCLGLPAIIIPIAENQIEIARSINAFGAAICIENEENIHEDMYKTIKILQSNYDSLEKMSEFSLKLVDGLGTERVVKELNL